MKYILSTLCVLATGTAIAQPATPGFKKLPSGIEYKFIKDAPGGVNPKQGDFIEVNIITSLADSVLFDSRKMNDNKPVQFQMQAPAFKGDVVEGIMIMTAGDEAEFLLSVDSLIKMGQPLPFAKTGVNQKLKYVTTLVSVKSEVQVNKEKEEAAGKQKGIDDKSIQDYFKKNNIKAIKTPTGMYYKIDREGTGAVAKAGEMVSVNYTGMTLNGEKFDSNVDPAFSHVEPFSFTVGQHQVIAGWDEAAMLMKKGTKATVYIPSSLAYGDRSPSPKIPANSVLVFDMEIMKIQTPEQAAKEKETAAAEKTAAQKATDDKLIQDYLKKNNIKATKTASGLYYKIDKEGTGALAQKGQNVTVDYTGKTLDGTAFDSNIDPAFQHQAPFSFELGQGRVIAGWDEGMALLKKGGKATFFIPSGLAYGERSPTPKIPNNAVLVFDVTITDIK